MAHQLEVIKKAALEAVIEWKAENTEENIKQHVHEQLKSIEEDTVLALLGMTKKWGRIGVSDEKSSPLRTHINKVKEQAISEFFEELNIAKLFTPAMKKEIMRDARDILRNAISSSVRSEVIKRSSDLAQEMVIELIPKIDVSKEIALLKLIGTEDESNA